MALAALLSVAILLGTLGYIMGDKSAPSESNVAVSATAVKQPAPVSMPIPTPVPITGKWIISEDTAKLDGSKVVTLMLQSEDQISGWPGKTATPTMILRCKENTTAAYLHVELTPKPGGWALRRIHCTRSIRPRQESV